MSKKMISQYKEVIESSVAGIPCLIGVSTYLHVKGSFSYHAPSDLDYYGYEEIEFDVLDRKGYAAPWLERKLTDDDTARIEESISEHYRMLAERDAEDYAEYLRDR